MSYKKKLKKRLYIAIAYLCIAVVLFVAAIFTENENASMFSTIFLILGLARIRQYKHITKDEETLRQREIMETDERNIMIWNKARSLTFTVYITVVGVSAIILQFIGKYEIVKILSLNIWIFTIIYWICYLIIRKKY